MPRKLRFYNLVAFVGGMSVMAVEMTAVRIMSPYFGSSIFVWTNILGIIMLALALGYYFGGKTADKFPRPQVFYTIILLTSVVIILLPFVASPILEVLSTNFSFENGTWIIMSLIGSIVLFFIPFALLGMISPYLVRLINKEVEETGRVAGRVFAMSTFGSIVGTFLPTLVTVPLLGVQRTIVIFGAALCLIAAIGIGTKKVAALFLLITSLGIIFSPAIGNTAEKIASTESAYSYMEIREVGDYIALAFSKTPLIQSVRMKDQVLTGGFYSDYYNLLPPLACPNQECKICLIGVAGAVIPSQINYFYQSEKDLSIDGIELDDEIIEFAGDYFDYDIPTLTLHHEDGRMFLRKNQEKYNLLILDAFQELEIPPHLSSREFFRLAAEDITDDGLFAVNVISGSFENSQYQRLLATIQQEFASVWDMQMPGSSNHMILASKKDFDLLNELDTMKINDQLGKLKHYAFRNFVKPPPIQAQLITDDLPLSEMLFDTMVYF